MQPHSISALAVAWYIFGEHYGEKIPRAAEIQIDWKDTAGRAKSLYHYATHIHISRRDGNENITQLQVDVKTTDGTPCTLTITRKTDGPYKQGEELYATHSVQHKAGLEEDYILDRRSIRGYHRNSWKYRNYKSTSASEGYFILLCEVRAGDSNRFVDIPYKVSIKPKEIKFVKTIIKEEKEEKEKKNRSIFTFGRKK